MLSFRKTNHSRHPNGFTLVEMLVVMALVGILSGMLLAVIAYVRQLSIQAECQNNQKEIGTVLQSMMMTSGGTFIPLVDENNVPWWARVEMELEGGVKGIDADTTTSALELPIQLPSTAKIFQCRAGGALDNSPEEADMATRIANLNRSISYGIVFDVMKEDGTLYERDPATNGLTAASAPASDADLRADVINFARIERPSEFILLADTDTQDSDRDNWTGGRITMGAIDRSAIAEVHPGNPPGNAPIAGRHGGFANILFADGHVASMQVDGEHWTKAVNDNTDLWTLPADSDTP